MNEQFQAVLDRINAATANIVGDIAGLKQQITDAGLPAAQEAEILTALDGIAGKLEGIAGETPETPEA